MLSIVIPTLNAQRHLPGCIAAIEAGRDAAHAAGMDLPDLEIIVVDGGSDDETVSVASNLGARVIKAERGRGPQLAEGARAAGGDWLLFLHADTRLGADWGAAAAGFLHNPAHRAFAAVFRFALDADGAAARRLESLVAWRCRVLALPYGDQGLLISRAFYDSLGGYSADPLMEDVDLVGRIGRDRLRYLNAAAVTSAERYLRSGWVLRSLRNLGCLGLYFLGLPAPVIARLYGR